MWVFVCGFCFCSSVLVLALKRQADYFLKLPYILRAKQAQLRKAIVLIIIK